MATIGVNANTQKVRWRIATDSVQSGLVSDIWDQTSQVLTALEFPLGFDSTTLTFQGSISALTPSGSNLTQSDPPNGIIRDNRYVEDPSAPLVDVRDEADAAVTVTVPLALPSAIGLDDILPELSAFRFLRVVGNVVQTPESFIRVHSKEP